MRSKSARAVISFYKFPSVQLDASNSCCCTRAIIFPEVLIRWEIQWGKKMFARTFAVAWSFDLSSS